MLGTHRDNAHFSRAGWRKRVMLPCWIIQILILLSVMGLFSYRLSHTVTTWEEEDNKGNVPVVEFVWEVANIAFSLLSLIVTCISIARFIAEVLTPMPMLFGCILNLVLSSVVLALDIVIYVQRTDRQYSLIGLGLDVALIFFTIIPLIYAAIIYRRLLNYDDYHLPGNHKAFGFAPLEEGIEDRSSLHLNPPTPYDPTNQPLGMTTVVTGGEPQTRGRSISLGSRRISLSLSRNASVSPHPSPALDVAQEPYTTYDHKRDTQFESYLAHRASQNSLQNDIKRALGDEFGFGDLPSPAEPIKTNARGEVVSSGAVPAGHASRPRVSAIGRQVSYEAILGGTNGSPIVTLTTPPEETLQRGTSLNSVPEAHEEEDHYANKAVTTRKRSVSESQQALLGDSNSDSRSGRRSPPRIERVEGLEDIELDIKKRRRDL
ncbi:hypothetical protein F4860DRAFT_19826 [Xylaria cubensis]|nr:hypothetical protein F4860DRAFT_19826 [Xylaria cubensis]